MNEVKDFIEMMEAADGDKTVESIRRWAYPYRNLKALIEPEDKATTEYYVGLSAKIAGRTVPKKEEKQTLLSWAVNKCPNLNSGSILAQERWMIGLISEYLELENNQK